MDAQKRNQFLGQLFQISRLAFPNYEHRPIRAAKFSSCGPVTLFVLKQLHRPEVPPNRWHRPSQLAAVSMPEAPMHEYHLPSSPEYKIRRPR
jgi:hypothetical protein